MKNVKAYGPRAPDGAAEKSLNLRITRDLHRSVVKAAKAAGVTLAEWIREAVRMRLKGEGGEP